MPRNSPVFDIFPYLITDFLLLASYEPSFLREGRGSLVYGLPKKHTIAAHFGGFAQESGQHLRLWAGLYRAVHATHLAVGAGFALPTARRKAGSISV